MTADVIRTHLRAPAQALWPLLLAMGAGSATLFAAVQWLPMPWRSDGLTPFVLAVVVGFGVGWLVEKLRDARSHSIVVELSAEEVSIGRRRLSLTEGAAALRGAQLDDRNVLRTLDIVLTRKKTKRRSLPMRELHAIVTYLREDGQRGPLETAAWVMVDQAAKQGAKGPALKIWIVEGRVVRGELVGGPRVVGGYTPDEHGPVPNDAVCYVVPTRFELPLTGRAWLEAVVERAKRVEASENDSSL